MAHHSGMTLLSLAYALVDRPMQRRFLGEPELHAALLLLHERVPAAAPEISAAELQARESQWRQPAEL